MSKDLLDLRRELVGELTSLLMNDDGEYATSTLEELSPPLAVIVEAMEAATNVLVAFERGYRIGGE